MKIKNNLLYGKTYVGKVKNQIQFVKHGLKMVSWRMNVYLVFLEILRMKKCGITISYSSLKEKSAKIYYVLLFKN